MSIISKITLLWLLLIFITVNIVRAEIKIEPKSIYLDISKDCVEIASAEEEEGFLQKECLSFPGIRIFHESGDAREWLSFQRENDTERTAITQFGYGHLKVGKIEIRYVIKNDRVAPIGAIYRISYISYDNIKNKQHPSKETQTIVVISFVGKEIHEVGRIDGLDPNANIKARNLLDESTSK